MEIQFVAPEELYTKFRFKNDIYYRLKIDRKSLI